jgi:hypothetical protein
MRYPPANQKETMRYLLAAILLFFVSSALAEATKGIVVWTGGCGSRYFVETSMVYGLLEWFGGWDPSKGEMIIGDLNSFGMKELYVLPIGQSTCASVDDHFMSRSNVLEKLPDKCR